MSNKVNKNRKPDEQVKEEENLGQETKETEEEVEEQEEEKKEELKPVPEEKLPLSKRERWFARHADQMDDVADKVVKVGKWVLGGALLIGAGMLIHKGLSDDESATIDVEAKDVTPKEPEKESSDSYTYGEF